jgi:hypothetical protein
MRAMSVRVSKNQCPPSYFHVVASKNGQDFPESYALVFLTGALIFLFHTWRFNTVPPKTLIADEKFVEKSRSYICVGLGQRPMSLRIPVALLLFVALIPIFEGVVLAWREVKSQSTQPLTRVIEQPRKRSVLGFKRAPAHILCAESRTLEQTSGAASDQL